MAYLGQNRSSAAHTSPNIAPPLLAQFQQQTPETYSVRDLEYDDIVTVQKARAVSEPFPPTPAYPTRGVRVLRWSGYALVWAMLGGVGGIVLGVMVILAALVGRVSFRRRVRRWRQTYPGAPLPAASRTEYDRLRGALGQAVLALLIGTGLLFVFLGNIR